MVSAGVHRTRMEPQRSYPSHLDRATGTGSQVQLEVDGQAYFIDLLFYHLRLHCYFVIELLCGRPHNSSSVAQPVMWRSAMRAAIFTPFQYLNAT